MLTKKEAIEGLHRRQHAVHGGGGDNNGQVKEANLGRGTLPSERSVFAAGLARWFNSKRLVYPMLLALYTASMHGEHTRRQSNCSLPW